MGNIGIIIIVSIISIVLFFLLREVNMWYWKINERIALMQEQNSLLKKLINGGMSQESVELGPLIEQSILEPTKETITHNAPKIIAQNITIENSILRGRYENIHFELTDGIKGSIFHNPSKNNYYFKEKSKGYVILHYYNNFESCVNAFHYFETTNQVLKVGFIGSFS